MQMLAMPRSLWCRCSCVEVRQALHALIVVMVTVVARGQRLMDLSSCWLWRWAMPWSVLHDSGHAQARIR